MLAIQLKYDLLMFSRELFYMIFSIVVPPVTYILMGSLYGEQIYAGNLSYAQTYTPSYILLITFSVIFFAFGYDQVVNRSTGVEKRISLSPVPKKILFYSSVLRSIIVTSFGFFIITMFGTFIYNVPFTFTGTLMNYGIFIIMNIILLVLASAIYSFFQEMKSALIFSIVLFQLVMLTGDFSLPVSMMPNYIQVIAQWNPFYHMNHLFIDIWNQQLHFDKNTALSISYILCVLVIACLILQFSNKRKYR